MTWMLSRISKSFADLPVAVAQGSHGKPSQKPMQDVQVVAILLDDDIAGQFPVAEPVPHPFQSRVWVGFTRERVVGDPGRTGTGKFADVSRLDPPVALQVLGGAALLEADRDGLGLAHLLRQFDCAFTALHIRANRLLAVNVLVGLDGRFEHAWMLERRRCDEDGVDVRRAEQFFEVGIGLRVFDLYGLLCLIKLILEAVADRRHAGARIGVHDARVIGSPVSRADQSNRNLRVGLCAAHRLWLDDSECCSCRDDARVQEVATSPASNFRHLSSPFRGRSRDFLAGLFLRDAPRTKTRLKTPSDTAHRAGPSLTPTFPTPWVCRTSTHRSGS